MTNKLKKNNMVLSIIAFLLCFSSCEITKEKMMFSSSDEILVIGEEERTVDTSQLDTDNSTFDSNNTPETTSVKVAITNDGQEVIVNESIMSSGQYNSIYGYLQLPVDIIPTIGHHIIQYNGYVFLNPMYSELITSKMKPEYFNDNNSVISDFWDDPGKEILGDPSDVSDLTDYFIKISVGDQFGDLTVKNAGFEYELIIDDNDSYGGSPVSAFLNLSGSVSLKGIVFRNDNLRFYIYTDSIKNNTFPFLNVGSCGFCKAFESIGIANNYETLCFKLNEDIMNKLEFNEDGYCEAEILFSNIKQEWNKLNDGAEFNMCYAESEEIVMFF